MKVRDLTHDHFDEDRLDLFWRFLVERQRIWVRRAHLQLPRPWTTDRALNYEFITNVYRELDPGTEYVLDVISAGELNENVAFNVMLYRLMGSSVVTHSVIGNFDVAEYAPEMLITRAKESGGNVFGDAYRVAGYEKHKGTGDGTKIENIAQMFANLAEQMPELWRRMQTSVNAKALYQVFNAIEGFGVFLSNQCMVDLLMISDSMDKHVWHFGTDEWCEPGPGAKRGIAALLAPGIRPANLQLVMAWLRDAQVDEFEERGLVFPYLLNRDDSLKYITICNIQTALCEFHKYVRSRGQIKVRAYTKTPSMLQAYDVNLTDEEMEALADISTCTPVENMYAKSDQNGAEAFQIPPFQVAQSDLALELRPDMRHVALEAMESRSVPQPTTPPQISPPEVPGGVHFDDNVLQTLLNTLQGRNQQQKPLVIPVDPTGLMGLPKAIVIVPIY